MKTNSEEFSKRQETAYAISQKIYELECVQKKLFNRLLEFDASELIAKELNLILSEQIDHKNKSLLLEEPISSLPEEDLLLLEEQFTYLDYFPGANISDIFSICLENMKNAINGYKLLDSLIKNEDLNDLIIFLQKQKEFHFPQLKKLATVIHAEIDEVIVEDDEDDLDEEQLDEEGFSKKSEEE
jgi:hypothetical protein